jgi:hypothetical protein
MPALAICESCGTKNSPNRKTCLSCGAEFSSGGSLADGIEQWPEPQQPKIDWFKGGLLGSAALIAFSIFYHYVIAPPRIEQITSKQAVRSESTPNTSQRAEIPQNEPGISFSEEREKAARELTRAQEEFERTLREDNARAEAKQRQEQLTREARNNEMKMRLALSSCLAQANNVHFNNWNYTCTRQGRPKGCMLLAPVASNLEQGHRAARDECFRMYPPDTRYGR